MCNLPLISVVVPNFNQGGFLTEALDSIFSQKDAFAEVIVIDGGSTDGSVDLIRRFQDRLAFWCSEPDQGHYDAVNKGMAQAHGEILGFLNSDDKLFPGSLRILREVFATYSEVEWVTSLVPIAWDICRNLLRYPPYSRLLCASLSRWTVRRTARRSVVYSAGIDVLAAYTVG